MQIEERLKLDEAKKKIEAVRDAWIQRKVPDQYCILQKIINDINSVLEVDMARRKGSMKGGGANDCRRA